MVLYTSEGAGRKPEEVKPFVERAYKRTELSSDAKILASLLKKQPQTKEELCKNSEVDGSTFYRSIGLLEEKGVVHCVDGMYTLMGFNPLDIQVENAFLRILSKKPLITASDLIWETGKPWGEIQISVIRAAKKLELTPCREGREPAFLKEK